MLFRSVLEHLRDPPGALASLKAVLKPGGTITVIKGDHGSTYFHPDDADARQYLVAYPGSEGRGGGFSIDMAATYAKWQAATQGAAKQPAHV